MSDRVVESIQEIKKLFTGRKSLFSSPDPKKIITFVADRAGHDRRYAIDASKIEDELGWRADEDFDSGIVKSVEWYIE